MLSRRTFLKALGALAATPLIVRLLPKAPPEPGMTIVELMRQRREQAYESINRQIEQAFCRPPQIRSWQADYQPLPTIDFDLLRKQMVRTQFCPDGRVLINGKPMA